MWLSIGASGRPLFSSMAVLLAALPWSALADNNPAAEVGENADECYRTETRVDNSGFFEGHIGCLRYEIYCPKKAEPFSTDPMVLTGGEPNSGPEGGSVSYSETHTVTAGTIKGFTTGLSAFTFGGFLRPKQKLLTKIFGEFGPVVSKTDSWTESNADGKSIVMASEIPPDTEYNFKLWEEKLRVTGIRYNFGHRLTMTTPEEMCKPDKPKEDFEVHYPIIKPKAKQYKAVVKVVPCATQEPGHGLEICPGGEVPDAPEDHLPPNENPPPPPPPDQKPEENPPPDQGKPPIQRPAEVGGACQENSPVGIKQGTCKQANSCNGDKDLPVPGRPDEHGNWPCKGDESITCCVKLSGADQVLMNVLPDGAPCNVDNRDGVCKDRNACLRQGKEALPGAKDPKTGKWPCPDGGKNIQCCVESNIPFPLPPLRPRRSRRLA